MRFQHIIARKPAKSLVDGITSANLGVPDYALAVKQHQNYLDALRDCQVGITLLPAEEAFPDSVFVEDVVLCTPHCAVMTRPGAVSRQGETALIEPIIQQFYPDKNIERITAPGTVEAGDIMQVGSHYYIGLSARTNQEGAEQMIKILVKYGLTGSMVSLKKVLHLKTGLSYLENNNLLAAGEFITKTEFKQFNIIPIDNDETYAANCIWVNGTVIMPLGYPKTHEKIATLGYPLIEVDTSEFRKIDGGLSCMSLRF